MFGWRKRSDGFEWREYVRTTILVRRKKRRDKINDVGRAAVDGIKDAGRAGADAGARGFAAGANKARAAFAAAAEVPGRVHAAGAPVARRVATGISGAVGRLVDAARTPPFAKPLAAVAAVAAVAGPARIVYGGVDAVGVLMLAIAGIGAAVYFWPQLAQLAATATGGPDAAWRSRLTPAMAAAGVAVAALIGGGGLLMSRHGGNVAALVPAPFGGAPTKTVTGRAVAVSGDQLRIGRTVVYLSGVESPERDQVCALANNRTWRCGQSAAQAMAKLIGGSQVTCRFTQPSATERARGSCDANGKDLAHELVASGAVFAVDGGGRSYTRVEKGAKNAKLGLWRGEPERPSDFRAKRWEEAKKQAPSGCPIKGQVTSEGGRYYVLPWSPRYERVKVQAGRGRWFCSEEEAQAAGWKPGERS